MRAAYLDTSFLLAEAFGERPRGSRHRVGEFDAVFASRFLEAEFRSAFRREGLEPMLELLSPVRWVDSARSLGPELDEVLTAGYLRGADCWHLATALSIAPKPHDLVFLTFDVRQRAIAKALGFRV
jgi:predicted nucleic acid-binding protein